MSETSTAALRRADFEAAIKKCTDELSLNPQNPPLLRKRGEAKRKLSQYKEAVADFNAALALQPKFPLALAGRGAARRAMGDLEEALRDFDAALKLEPHNALVLIDRGSARYALGRSQDALADAEAALKIRPHSVTALQLRGELRRKLGKHQEAISDFDAALQFDPQHVPALAGRGAARRALGLRAEAIADYDAALALAPRNTAVLAGRGAARLELRMAEKAKADFEAALVVDPNSEFAKWGRDAAAEQMRTAGLQITLVGFKGSGLNAKYVERRRPGFSVNGLATYWSLDGVYFLYYCEKESRWKGTRWDNLEKVQKGGGSGFIAAPIGADVRSPTRPSKGWAEWDSATWVLRKTAGVASVVSLEVNIQTVTLQGFQRPELNGRFGERYRPRFIVNGRETYWSGDGERFLYWSAKEGRWKGTLATDLNRVSTGRNLGFIGAPGGVDILAPALAVGWHEWDGKEWRFLDKAGVGAVGALAVAQNNKQAPPKAAGAAEPPAKKPRIGEAGAPAAPVKPAEPMKVAPAGSAIAKVAAAAAQKISEPKPLPAGNGNGKVVPKVPVFVTKQQAVFGDAEGEGEGEQDPSAAGVEEWT